MKNKKNTKCPICGWDINDKLPKLKVLRAVRPFDKLGNDKLPGDCGGQLRKVTLKECARLSRRSAAAQIKALKEDNEARANAVIAIIPGAGCAESCDWAEMLLRMYTKWAELHKCGIKLLKVDHGEDAKLHYAAILVSGPRVYDCLKPDSGVHRLTRISPFDPKKRRHTSFAAVAVKTKENWPVQSEINWKNQVRTYTFHPYKLAKDLRTGVETKDVQSVMDGNIDCFAGGFGHGEVEL